MPLSAAMAAQPRAILLDALGTPLGCGPPAPHRGAALRARGHDVTLEAAQQAIRAEIAYYRAHLHEGADAAALADLRARCAAAMSEAIPLAHDVLLEALLASLRFFAYPDSAPALRALRDAGIRTVVVSNWDWSLHERLHETGLATLVDVALASAEGGAAKPDGGTCRAARGRAGAAAHEAWHAGDTPEADVAGAHAAGLAPILIARD